MKKDFELIRRILKAIEDHEGPDEDGMDQGTLELNDIDKNLFFYHTKILTKEGLIESEKEVWISDDYPKYLPSALTGKGREFLIESSNSAKWKKALIYISETGKDIAVSVMAEYLKKLTLP